MARATAWPDAGDAPLEEVHPPRADGAIGLVGGEGGGRPQQVAEEAVEYGIADHIV